MTNFAKKIFIPTWHLENVRQIARENPYTYYVPSVEMLNTLKVGSLVKLCFVNDNKNEDNQLNAERMWVVITQINEKGFVGKLDNTPYEMKQLKSGDMIHFQTQHIMDIYGDDPVPTLTNQYLDKCWTTRAILDAEVSIGFICRDEPMDDEDSGWQIFSGEETDEYMDDPDNVVYIAIGRLLNLDDSYIHLLNAKIGTAFEKNEQGEWIEDNEFSFDRD